MEDILKFLLVAGVLVVAFIRQAKKEAQKKQTSLPPFMPQPEAPSAPLPDEPKDRTYDGYIPEGPAPEPAKDRLPSLQLLPVPKLSGKPHKPSRKQSLSRTLPPHPRLLQHRTLKTMLPTTASTRPRRHGAPSSGARF